MSSIEIEGVIIEACDRLHVARETLAAVMQGEDIGRLDPGTARSISGAMLLVGDALRELDEAIKPEEAANE